MYRVEPKQEDLRGYLHLAQKVHLCLIIVYFQFSLRNDLQFPLHPSPLCFHNVLMLSLSLLILLCLPRIVRHNGKGFLLYLGICLSTHGVTQANDPIQAIFYESRLTRTILLIQGIILLSQVFFNKGKRLKKYKFNLSLLFIYFSVKYLSLQYENDANRNTMSFYVNILSLVMTNFLLVADTFQTVFDSLVLFSSIFSLIDLWR